MTISSIAALFGTMLVLSVTPGPSDFAVVARSVTSGFRHALIMIAGIVVADFLFIVMAVYSLAAIAETMGSLFLLVKYSCGAYLIWLGLTVLRSPLSSESGQALKKHSGLSGFMGGLLITLGDPKAILFYIGLLPAFVDMTVVTINDTVIIMLVATVVICGVKASYAYLADRATRFFDNLRVRQRLNFAAGGVLIAAGVFIVVTG